MKRYIVFFLIWFVFFFILYTVVYVTSGQERLQFLANSGTHVKGIVQAKQPAMHRTIVYKYQAGGIDFVGIGNAGEGHPDFDSLKVGDEISVIYDPEYPADSITGDPQSRINANSQFIWMVSIMCSVIPTALVVTLYLLYRSTRKSS